MKNKKINKIVTVVVMITVFLSVACVSASAYVYEGENAEYFVPDYLFDYEKNYENIVISSSEDSYSSSSYDFERSGSEFVTFNSSDMLFHNFFYNTTTSITGYSQLHSISFLSKKEFNKISYPVVYKFAVTARCSSGQIPSLSLHYVSEGYDIDESSFVFNIQELSDMLGYTFYHYTEADLQESFVTFDIDVEVIVDRRSGIVFFTMTDEKGISFTRNVPYVDCNSVGFELVYDTVDNLSSNWEYMGFVSKYSGYETNYGFSCYDLVPILDYSDLLPPQSNKVVLDGSSTDGIVVNNSTYLAQELSISGSGALQNYALWKTYAIEGKSQGQLWIPNKETGLIGFSSKNRSIGYLSMSMNYSGDDIMTMKFVEADPEADIRWSDEWCIVDDFLKIVPVYEDSSTKENLLYYSVYGWDGLLTTIEADYCTGWFDFKVGIELNPLNDTISLHYYINDEYIRTSYRKLTTLNNTITCVYLNSYTSTYLTGLEFDDFVFQFSNTYDYLTQYRESILGFVDKIYEGETSDNIDNIQQRYKDLVLSVNRLELENKTLKDTNIKLGADIQGQKGTDAIDKVFSGTWQGISGMVMDFFDLGIDLDKTPDSNGNYHNEITIGSLAVIVIVCFIIVKILPLLIGLFAK